MIWHSSNVRAISLVTLPDGLSKIGADAFSYCKNMKYSLFIPKSVQEIGHHAFYQCENLEVFYLEAENEEMISLGGSWLPKKENEFKADPPVFNASYSDSQKYNSEKAVQEKPALSEEVREPTAEEILSDTSGEFSKLNARNSAEINYTVVTLLIIFVFVPCSIMIVLEVVRNLFKEDFLMTKRQKEKLKKKREKARQLKEEYAQQQNTNAKGDGE